MQITLTLDRGDFDRISNLLGNVAGLAGCEALAPALEQLITPMPPEDARRLVDEMERQAQKQGA